MIYSTQPKPRSSKRRAILHALLCVRHESSNVSKPEEKPPVRYTPTHAAKSFLATTTPKVSPNYPQCKEIVGRLDLAYVNRMLRVQEQAESSHIEHADDNAPQHQGTLGGLGDGKHADALLPSALPLAASAVPKSQGPLPPMLAASAVPRSKNPLPPITAVQRPLTPWAAPTNWHTPPSVTSLQGPSAPWAPQFNFDTPYPDVPGWREKMRGRGHGHSPPRDSLDLKRPRIGQDQSGYAVAVWSEYYY